MMSRVEINHQDHEENTALHVSSLIDSPDIARLLYKNGADPFIGNNDSLSPTTLSDTSS